MASTNRISWPVFKFDRGRRWGWQRRMPMKRRQCHQRRYRRGRWCRRRWRWRMTLRRLWLCRQVFGLVVLAAAVVEDDNRRSRTVAQVRRGIKDWESGWQSWRKVITARMVIEDPVWREISIHLAWSWCARRGETQEVKHIWRVQVLRRLNHLLDKVPVNSRPVQNKNKRKSKINNLSNSMLASLYVM